MDVSTSERPATHGQVSFLVQPLSDGIKGHPFLSMLRDSFVEEQLIVWVVISGEGRGTVSVREIESHICGEQPTITPHKRYSWMMVYDGVIIQYLWLK